MPRRRLRLHCSSDEEGEGTQQQPQNEPPHESSAVSNQPVSLSPPNPNPAEPLPISDDDFVDVDESFAPSPVDDAAAPVTLGESSGSPIGDSLSRMGLKLRREWLDSCIQGLERSVPRFSALDVSAKAKLCFQQFLLSDMNYSGGGILPENVDSMHLVDLKGPFVLQVDEIVNISCPLKGRYQDTPSGIKRCLKLSMTDGVQRIFGMEYRPIKDLHVLAPSGLKDIETARQRLVAEVNKPPRGKRTKIGVVPPLATRATLAAWPLNGVNFVESTNNLISQNSAPFQTDERATTQIKKMERGRERECKFSYGKDREVHGGGIWSVFVDNLSRRVSRRALGEHFSYHGKVIRVFIPFINNRPKYKDCTFAFVHFASKEDLCNAVEKMNNVRVNGRIIYVSVAKYDKRSEKKSREGIRAEGSKRVETGELKGRRMTSPAQVAEKMERMNRFIDGRTYRDTVVGVKKVPKGHQLSSQGNKKEEKKSLEVFIPVEERLWLKFSLTGICKGIFEVDFVQKALRNEGFKVKVIRWGFVKNACLVVFQSVEEIRIAMEERWEALSFWFEILEPDQTAHRVDCRVAQMLLRVESPFDIPDHVIINTYGRKFMIKINVECVEDIFPELTDMEEEEVTEDPWEESSLDWSNEEVQNRQEEQVGEKELSESHNRVENGLEVPNKAKTQIPRGEKSEEVNEGRENGKCLGDASIEHEKVDCEIGLHTGSEIQVRSGLDHEERLSKDCCIGTTEINVVQCQTSLQVGSVSLSSQRNSRKVVPGSRVGRGNCKRVYSRSRKWDLGAVLVQVRSMLIITRRWMGQRLWSAGMGLGRRIKARVVRRVVEERNPLILFIQESKLEVLTQLVVRKMGGNLLTASAVSAAEGSAGGLITLWNEKECQDEKIGGAVNLASMFALRDFVSKANLVDLPLVGGWFCKMMEGELEKLCKVENRQPIFNILKGVQEAAKRWSRKDHLEIPGRINMLEKEIHEMELHLQQGLPMVSMKNLVEAKKELWDLYKKEESISLQKSRLKWSMGIRTLDFSTNVQEGEEGEMENTLEVEELELEFLQLSNQQSMTLEKPFSEEEISDGNKAPGPDGLNLGFFKKFWSSLKEVLLLFFKEFYEGKEWDLETNHSFLSLIPKRANPKGKKLLVENSGLLCKQYGSKFNDAPEYLDSMKNLCVRAGNGETVQFWHDVWLGTVPLKDSSSLSLVEEDCWIWLGNGEGYFTAKSFMKMYFDREGNDEIEGNWERYVWKGVAPPRVETFVWQLAHHRVAVKEELLKRGVTGVEDTLCPLCRKCNESVSHLFLHCDVVWDLWVKFLKYWNVFFVVPGKLMDFLIVWDELVLSSIIWKFIPRVVMWSVWKCRNEDVHIPFDSLMGDLKLADLNGNLKKRSPSSSRWSPPSEGFLKVNVDGAIVKGWDKGGIGGLIRDGSGSVLGSFSEKRIILESDSTNALKWINNPDLSTTLFKSLVRDIATRVERKGIITRHISRAANWCSALDVLIKGVNRVCYVFRVLVKGATFVSSSTVTTQRTVDDPTAHTRGVNAVPSSSSDVAVDVERMHIDSVPISREDALSNSNTAPDNEHIHVVDVVEHPLILSGNREVPFTYLASLSARWAAVKDKATHVQGKIKCFLTGVKGFQYKQRTTYELLCYVDDGSLISEILIDHNVVQRGIGRSPQEVTAALSSSDKQIVSDMKEIMRQFQAFLAHFECYTQEGMTPRNDSRRDKQNIFYSNCQGDDPGLSYIDARLLLRRLNHSSCQTTPEHRPPDPIEISP
ncbi:RecQ-mediated genome instability protein 1 [Hibiscus syriacus]|uniref:RecQ-mediated genome instability protein 1 n=1 Tax=Hibiscus syriacus TaxID=106335 RepID=A0A6A2XJ45_HIBSY|nr:RecQ-mediated genome instability protein 1 [Hibiscus syriacus]